MEFEDIKGQPYAKRAIEIAIAGKHNASLEGPMGCGKTAMLEAIKNMLPDTTVNIDRWNPLPKSSVVEYVLIDNVPTIKPDTIDRLINIQENSDNKFCIIATWSPCSCGNFSHPEKTCRCSPLEIYKHQKKISNSFKDNMALRIDLPAIRWSDLASGYSEESDEAILKRIDFTIGVQAKRGKRNNDLDIKDIGSHCRLDDDSKKLLEHGMKSFGFSPRVYYNIHRVARTIADHSHEDKIKSEHLAEALQYAILDKDLK